MRRVLLALLTLLAFPPVARARDRVERWRDPLPAREVERPLALPRGWIALDVGYDEHLGRGWWTSDGVARRFGHVRWARWSERVQVAGGVSRRVEVWGEVPFVEARLADDRRPLETVSRAGLGDARLGVRVQVLHQEAPSSSLAFESDYTVPFARAAAGAWAGGTTDPRPLALGSGTPDWYAGGAWRRAFGPVRLTARLGWVHRFAGAVGYAVEPASSPGRIAPGDQLRARAEVLLQAGPLVLAATPAWGYRLATRVGENEGLFTPNRHLREVAGSAGSWLDLRLDLRVQVSRGLAVGGYYARPLLGEDLDFFPIESLEPTWGPDFGASVEARL